MPGCMLDFMDIMKRKTSIALIMESLSEVYIDQKKKNHTNKCMQIVINTVLLNRIELRKNISHGSSLTLKTVWDFFLHGAD